MCIIMFVSTCVYNMSVCCIGLLSMYALLIILYIGGISLFSRSVWQTIQKGGPMHEVNLSI